MSYDTILCMKKTIFIECFLLTLLSGLLVWLLNPFNLMMKVMLSGGVIVCLIVLYLIKFFVIFKETPQDERDLQHRYHSSWASYSMVSILLFVGVIVESLQGDVDVWLVIAFAGMLISKLLSLIYLEVYK